MSIGEEIKAFTASLPKPKRYDLNVLHELILSISPGAKLWFFDGRNEQGKIVSNPNIGYGIQTKKYADGKTKEFYQVGISSNKTGISVYILGIADKTYLVETFADKLGKAHITGYCIKFKSLKDIDLEILKEAITVGFEHRRELN